MVTFEQLQLKQERVCVVGLGYVGLPLAVLLSKHFSVIGVDINQARIDQLRQGIDVTKEVTASDVANASIEYTCDPQRIAEAKFIIVAVPTPITSDKQPDLRILARACEMVGKHMVAGSIVVYESTVFPGATEDVCLPILTEHSGLSAPKDFSVGYSPERVNPGDRAHTIDKIVKVVSGLDAESTSVVSQVYGTITNIYEATSIRVAEAAKVIENTQRDVNIALMNELALLFAKMDISIYDVLEAAGTKWNFLPFQPGLVGGHCIGVDPYYLTHTAQQLGYDPEMILAGRGINDRIPMIIAKEFIDLLRKHGKDPAQSTAVVLGVTFKENIPDIRNSKVVDVYRTLVNAGMNVQVFDPHADTKQVADEYGFSLTEKDALIPADLLVVAVAHDEFTAYSADDLAAMTVGEGALVADVKHLYDAEPLTKKGILYWSL